MPAKKPKHLQTTKRPFVLVNMAMTADGKITSAAHSISSFSSRVDRLHLLQLRAGADAVMAGARTVSLDPTTLGPGGKRFREKRLREGLAEFNLRVVVSGSASVSPDAEVFKHRFSPIILLVRKDAPEERLSRLRPLVQEIKAFGEAELNLAEALHWIWKEFGVKRLVCEGGGDLNFALFQQGLVDELHLTICPFVMGGAEAPTICDGAGIPGLSDAVQLELKSMRRAKSYIDRTRGFGPGELRPGELFLVYTVVRNG